MFCGIQFLLGHDGITSTLFLWGIYYGCFAGHVVKVFCNIWFGWLQNFGCYCKETGVGLGLLLIFVFGLVIFLSASDDTANLSGQILPSGVHTAQYFECSVIIPGAAIEVGKGLDRVSISWLPCMGASLVHALYVTSLASWVKLLPMVDAQFS